MVDGQRYMQYPSDSGDSSLPLDVNPLPGLGQANAAPTQFVPTPTSQSLANWQISFLNQSIVAAQQAQQISGVPTSVTIAQAIEESDWGRATIGGNNYFGIKAENSPGPAGVVLATTREFVNGAWITVQAPFRAYNSMTESFLDHAEFFTTNRRYAVAMQHTADPRLFARLINQAGYATDPNYATKLITLMDRYDLYRYDVPMREG
ncbi:MAG TPA: glucosaminidase domain-containing protein [Chloroflexota bacterium]|nr:glucosaminidase domain-containing protein [Chloroflexota bacterium]